MSQDHFQSAHSIRMRVDRGPLRFRQAKNLGKRESQKCIRNALIMVLLMVL
jgi:hypothetical protein